MLVGAIGSAAGQLRIPRPHSPWLPPLPPLLLLRRPLRTGLRGGEAATAPFGLVDLPDQRQQPRSLDLDTFTHLWRPGHRASGRSQLLRTIAGSLALAHSSADVHLYGIDCGNGALLPLADLPHCGAVVTRTQTERADRLLSRLGAELTRRQELLAAAGSPTSASSGPPSARLSGCRTSWCCSTAGRDSPPRSASWRRGRLTEIITRLLGEGASAGLHLVMTGDRSLLVGPDLGAVRGEAGVQAGREGGLPARRARPARPARRDAARAGVPCRDRRRAAGGAARARTRPGKGRRPQSRSIAAALPGPRRRGAGGRAAVPGRRAAVARSPSPTPGSCGPRRRAAVGHGRGRR